MAETKITFLGTGAANVTQCYNSCFLMQNDTAGLLVDTGGGNGILSQLEKANVPIEKINQVFISHVHMDHLLGLFWVLRILGPRITKGHAEHLEIIASEKVIQVIRSCGQIFLKKKVLNLFDNKISFRAVRDLDTIVTDHGVLIPFNLYSEKEEEYGFRLNLNNEKSFVFLGDEPYKAALINMCQNADYFFHNAFCLEDQVNDLKPHRINHSTAKDAATAATEVKAKNLIISHIEDHELSEPRKIAFTKEAEKYFAGNIFVPEDLETLSIV